MTNYRSRVSYIYRWY